VGRNLHRCAVAQAGVVAATGAFKGSVFLLSLIVCASLMPVEKLPAASWQTALGLGFVSAVFDNIPLTALRAQAGRLRLGAISRYAVGFGGSMIWFGSSAGVALSSMYPQARSVGLWLKHGWHVALAYVIGFFVLYAVLGWHPNAPHKTKPLPPSRHPARRFMHDGFALRLLRGTEDTEKKKKQKTKRKNKEKRKICWERWWGGVGGGRIPRLRVCPCRASPCP